jgi:RNA 3'-terminal phosphate cyclase
VRRPTDCFTVRAELTSDGPGAVTLVTTQFEHVTEVFREFGMPRASAGTVGQSLASTVRASLRSNAPVGADFADQLLAPMALGNGDRLGTVDRASTGGQAWQSSSNSWSERWVSVGKSREIG